MAKNITNNFLNVFPTLIASFDLDQIDNDVLKGKMDVAGNINHGLLENGISSYVGGEDCFLTRLGVQDLKKAIQYHLQEYCFHSGIAPNVIVNSWANVLHEAGYVRRHRHEKSILSGAYYPVDSDTCLVLENPNTIFQMTQTNVNDTIYNADKIIIKPTKGKLVIWPSYVYHYTETNSDKPRYTVSFNTLDDSYKHAINRT